MPASVLKLTSSPSAVLNENGGHVRPTITPRSADFDGYLMVQKDSVQIHFFEFTELDPKENYGQVYIRTDEIDKLYQLALDKKLTMPEAGRLQMKPWRQKEFSLLDPDNNLLTFGQSI